MLYNDPKTAEEYAALSEEDLMERVTAEIARVLADDGKVTLELYPVQALALTQMLRIAAGLDGMPDGNRALAEHMIGGLLAIHAGRTFPAWAVELCLTEPFFGALAASAYAYGSSGDPWPYSLPRGAIVAVVRLVACRRVETLGRLSETERAFGDFRPGRYAWVLEEPRRMTTPRPARGRMKLWDWTPPPDVAALLGER